MLCVRSQKNGLGYSCQLMPLLDWAFGLAPCIYMSKFEASSGLNNLPELETPTREAVQMVQCFQALQKRMPGRHLDQPLRSCRAVRNNTKQRPDLLEPCYGIVFCPVTCASCAMLYRSGCCNVWAQSEAFPSMQAAALLMHLLSAKAYIASISMTACTI